ncbi:MAG TPA: XrtA system polysaccharide chain length determinant [Gammaproteobacteria bacterium]|nr:XrtA system polysaccharide chain length determinant [Gammaproteobacteria bacterium]
MQQIISQARGAWRFRWYALLVAWLVAIAGWVFVYSLPDQYQANTRVYADADTMLAPLLKGLAIRPDVHERVQLMAQTLLSRPNLEKVARETGLGLRASTPKGTDELLDKLKARIDVEGGGRQDLYSISYTDRDPKMAQKVVQSLLNILMTNTLGTSMQSSGAAQNFLQRQIKEYRRRLQAAEQRLAEFKKTHLGLVPGQGGSDYFARLQAAQQGLTQLKEQLDVAKSQRDSIQSQMQAIKNGDATITVNPRIQQIDQQIAAYREKLNNLLLRYTPQYPDVIAYKQMIAQLQKTRDKVQKGGGATFVGDPSTNPVYQNMQTELYNAKVQITTLQSKIQRQTQRLAKLKNKADKVTDLETQLASLTRDYSVTKRQYQDLLARLDKAEMTQDASHSGNNLKFRIIEPPVEPLIASGPPRAIFLAVVLVFALGAGALFAIFMHQVRPVFMDRESLKAIIGRPVLGVVSIARSSVERHLLRAEVMSFVAGVLLLTLVFAGALLFQDQITHMVQGALPGSWLI